MNVGNSETEVPGTITGNIISGGSVAGICQADGFFSMSATIERNVIVNNQFGILTRTNNDDSIIRDNTITHNKIGICGPTSRQTITGNNIQDNSQYNLQAGQTTATAKNNWWGTTDSQAISQTIYDNKDDFNLGKVAFEPFLTEPNSQATPDNSTVSSPFPSPNMTPTPTESPPTTPDQSGTSDTDSQTGISLTEAALVAAVIVLASLLLVTLGLLVRKRTTKSDDRQTLIGHSAASRVSSASVIFIVASVTACVKPSPNSVLPG
jgi:hypothetical protein